MCEGVDLCLCVVLFVPLLQLHTDLAALADTPHIHDDCCCYTDPFSSTRVCVCVCMLVCVYYVCIQSGILMVLIIIGCVVCIMYNGGFPW